MGLDGISVNQLRITPENNSAELNNHVKLNSNDTIKSVDGLAYGNAVDPDKNNKNKNDETFEFDEDEEENKGNKKNETIIKYDLSNTDKYELKIDDKSSVILIIDKTTEEIVQKISSDTLSKFVGFLSNSEGSIINRKL